MQSSKKDLPKRYEKYINVNRKEIINSFCELIKKYEEGDMNLEEYGRFRFWQYDQADNLNKFYSKFKKDVGDSTLEYLEFSRLLWNWLNDTQDEIDIPSEFLSYIKTPLITGEA